MGQYLKQFYGEGKQIDRSDGSTAGLLVMREFCSQCMNIKSRMRNMDTLFNT